MESTASPETTVAGTTTSTVPDCGPIRYDVGTFPAAVEPGTAPTDDVSRDAYTAIPGTVSKIWLNADGELAMAFVRGSLPPEEWPGERGEVSIDGARGVAGPFEDGTWVVAWFEEDGTDPCDRYFLVFYAPVTPTEVEATVASLDRRAG